MRVLPCISNCSAYTSWSQVSLCFAAPSKSSASLTQMCLWLIVMTFLYLTEELLLVHYILISVCLCVFVWLCELYQIPADSLHQCLKSTVKKQNKAKKKVQLKPWDRSRTVLSCDLLCSSLTLYDQRFPIPSFWLRRQTFTWTGWHPGVLFVMNILCHIVHQVVPTVKDAKQSLFITDESNIAIMLFQTENTFLMLNHLLPGD